MATGACLREGCTVEETGHCLLSFEDPSTCPDFSGRSPVQEQYSTPESEIEDDAPLAAQPGRRFPAGLELGAEDAAELMRARYGHLIGIVGPSDAGKTCFLLSLYQMASGGLLPRDYAFAGSETLLGFEARARRLREWARGPLPEQLADRTVLTDLRRPALMHLAIRRRSTQSRFELILTDLPGEWSEELVKRAAAAKRFEFLRRADGLILAVDAEQLTSDSRYVELQRSCHLLERFKTSVRIALTTPLVLLVTKSDLVDMVRPAAIVELEGHARSLGFNPKVVLCAAFSRTKAHRNGEGVFEALEYILSARPLKDQHRQQGGGSPQASRVFLGLTAPGQPHD